MLSVHLFVENLVDRLIEKHSKIAKSILDDHRTYSFSVKLALVFHMGLLPDGLFENLRILNALRNEYAHEIDVDLSKQVFRRMGEIVDRKRAQLFHDRKAATKAIEEDPTAGIAALHRVREATFGWLWDVARSHGVAVS